MNTTSLHNKQIEGDNTMTTTYNHNQTRPEPTCRKCPECERVFDLRDYDDANEWHYGHDCEGS